MAEFEGAVGLPEKFHEPFFRYADTTGDGTGTINFNGNYSSTQGVAILAAGGTQKLVVARLVISIEDSAAFRAEEYGAIGTALTNGIEIQHMDADGTTVHVDMTGGNPIKTNGDWGSLSFDIDVKSWRTGASGNELLLCRWSFWKAGTPGVHLLPSESIRIFLDDDLTGLINHKFNFQGFDQTTSH